jgi:hypothetical protein
MNSRINPRTLLILVFAGTFASAVIVVNLWAQDATVTTLEHGPFSYETTVRNAELAYVEGNNLVLLG